DRPTPPLSWPSRPHINITIPVALCRDDGSSRSPEEAVSSIYTAARPRIWPKAVLLIVERDQHPRPRPASSMTLHRLVLYPFPKHSCPATIGPARSSFSPSERLLCSRQPPPPALSSYGGLSVPVGCLPPPPGPPRPRSPRARAGSPRPRRPV